MCLSKNKKKSSSINLSSFLDMFFFFFDFGVLFEEGMSVKWWYKKNNIKAINKIKEKSTKNENENENVVIKS